MVIVVIPHILRYTSSLPEGSRIDLLAAGRTALGVEQVLHAALPVEYV